jgi:hypothetical protein
MDLMKIIFSRKGVDSAAGRCASALVDGRPVSLPIQTSTEKLWELTGQMIGVARWGKRQQPSHTYATWRESAGRILFWGLFRKCERGPTGWRYAGPRRHVIFGCLQVDEVVDLGSDGSHALTRHPWLLQHAHGCRERP